jgi:hypothetical protein
VRLIVDTNIHQCLARGTVAVGASRVLWREGGSTCYRIQTNCWKSDELHRFNSRTAGFE